MNKRRRHATRISESPSLATRAERYIGESTRKIREYLAGFSLSRLAMIPALVIGAAACSLVLGIGNSPAESNTTQSTPSIDTALTSTARSDKSIALKLDLNRDHSSRSEPLENPSITEQITDSAIDIEGNRYQLNLSLQDSLLNDNIEATPEASTTVKRETVKSGDTLSELFQRVGLGANTVYRITNSGKPGKALTRMYPGEELIFEFDQEQEVQTVTRIKSELEQIKFTANGDSFSTETITLEPEIRQIQRGGSVNSSLSESAYEAGISSLVTMNMANIFGGVMDFALDVRPGDHFTVIYEELYLNGEKIDDGKIVAAQYVNSGKVFNAYRYEDSKGDVGYFNEDGESMRKVFLRAPLDFTRVSSGFNLRRLHPITKKVKPHRGIDYAAPTGTPIFSVGDGRVSKAGYSKANGNYIFIRHGESYVTKYLHLKKRNVSTGQRIKQGQIIGSVGCTGLCTGPHLHYEFLVNGVHRNPRTIVSKLPKAKRLAKSELPRFNVNTKGQQELIEHYGYKTTIALSD